MRIASSFNKQAARPADSFKDFYTGDRFGRDHGPDRARLARRGAQGRSCNGVPCPFCPVDGLLCPGCSQGRGRLRPSPRPLLLPPRRSQRCQYRPTATTQSLWELLGRGKTEWPRALGILARTQGAEAVNLCRSSAGSLRRSREQRPGSFYKFARGPMRPSVNGRSSSLIIQGLDSSMHDLGHNSRLAGSTKTGAEVKSRRCQPVGSRVGDLGLQCPRPGTPSLGSSGP